MYAQSCYTPSNSISQRRQRLNARYYDFQVRKLGVISRLRRSKFGSGQFYISQIQSQEFIKGQVFEVVADCQKEHNNLDQNQNCLIAKESIRTSEVFMPNLTFRIILNFTFEAMRNIIKENEIFLENQSAICDSDLEIQYQKSSGQNQNQYLSQFLNSEGFENLQQIIPPKSQQPKSEQQQMIDQRFVSNTGGKQNLGKKKKRQKSCFHNFQKHLVITLRNVIKIKKSTKAKEIETVGHQMWQVFTKSTLYSKKFLHVLFGVYGNNEENQFSKHFLNDLGFMEVFAKYHQDSIKEAQNYLRKEIINQLQQINLKEYLSYRKLKRVDEFKKYIEEFLGQLKEGSVRRRLPKQTKIKMVNETKSNSGSPETNVSN